MNRREVSFLLLGSQRRSRRHGVCANGEKAPALASGVYAWDAIPVEQTATGQRRAVFDGYTTTVDRLETHVTTLNPGKAPHAAHNHPDEELVYVREGVVEVTINGVT